MRQDTERQALQYFMTHLTSAPVLMIRLTTGVSCPMLLSFTLQIENLSNCNYIQLKKFCGKKSDIYLCLESSID